MGSSQICGISGIFKTSDPMNTAPRLPLNLLPCGHRGLIDSIEFDLELQARFAALGVQPGKSIQMIRQASLGGPFHIQLGTTEIMLRRQEAARIKVRPMHEPMA